VLKILKFVVNSAMRIRIRDRKIQIRDGKSDNIVCNYTFPLKWNTQNRVVLENWTVEGGGIKAKKKWWSKKKSKIERKK
jgi:hypothetical protein